MISESAGKRMSWDRVTALAVGLTAVAVFAIYGAAAIAYVDRTIDYLFFPFGNDYGEGPILYQVSALAAGEPIYQPIDRPPYFVSNYPPLFHYATWGLMRIVGDPLVAGRMISFLGALASTVLIFMLVSGTLHGGHGAAARRIGGALAALFFVTHYTVVGWSAMMRVDMLALVFGLLGMHLFVVSMRRPSLAWVYGLAFVLVGFTKPNMIAAALATFGVAFLLDRRKALAAIGTSVLACLLALAAATLATDGEFLRHVVYYNVNEYRLDLLLKRLRQSAYWRSVDLVLCAGTVGWLLVGLAGRARAAGARPGGRDLPLLLFGGLMLASLVNVLGSGKTGASVSYFLEFEAAASLIVGTLAVRFATRLRADAWGPDCRNRRLLAIIALAVLCWQGLLGWSLKYREPNWPSVTYSRQVADLIATADGPVVSEEMVLLHQAGRPAFFQPFIMTRLERDGRWDSSPVVGAMERGEVSFVVLYSEFGSATYLRRLPDGFRDALETRYRLLRRVGHLKVFVPI